MKKDSSTNVVEKLIQQKGVFQKRLAFALTLLALPNGAQLVIGIFLTYMPNEYSCRLPPDYNTTTMDHNSTEELYVGKCSLDWSASPNSTNSTSTNHDSAMNTGRHSDNASSCHDYGWQYFPDEDGVVSAAMEFDWVCSREWMAPFLFSAQMFGLMAGSTFGAAVPDKFGRKWTFIVTSILKHLLTFLAGLSPNSLFLYICMGISFLMTMIQSLGGIIIANEVLDDKLRQIVSMTQLGVYAVGYMYLPALAYVFPDWRWLTCSTAVVGFATLPALYYIVESPRWLLLKGRKEEAFELLRKIARVNGVSRGEIDEMFVTTTTTTDIGGDTDMDDMKNAPEPDANNNSKIEVSVNLLVNEKQTNTTTLITNDKSSTDGKEEHQQLDVETKELEYLDLFRMKALRYRIFICSLSWSSATLLFFGSSFNTNELGGNRYANCFVSGAVEIPGFLMCVFLLDRIGGRLSYIFFTSTAAVLLLGTASLTSVSQPGMLACAMVAKMMISGSFNVNYSHTAELFPTLLRNQAYGTCSFFSRISSVLAPYLLYIGKLYSMSIPYVVMAIVAIMSFVSFYYLPETKGQHIPDTIEDILQQEQEKKSRKPLMARSCVIRRHATKKTEHVVAVVDESKTGEAKFMTTAATEVV